MSETLQPKWQPVLLVTTHRIECECGALAIFVVLVERIDEDGMQQLRYNAFCQPCFQKDSEDKP
jgi:hypothetical protein